MNFFCLYGPNTNLVVNGSLVAMTESAVLHVMLCIRRMLAGGHAAAEVREGALDSFCSTVDEVNANMAWGIAGVDNWYKNERGRVTQNWPLTVDDYYSLATDETLDAHSVHGRPPD